MITGNGTPETIAGIFPHHLAKLRASGLTDETIRANRLKSVDDARQLSELLGRTWSRKNGSALVIPYIGEGGDTILTRARPDNPPKRNDKPQKYLHPTGVAPRPYFPQGVREVIGNRDQPIIVTEGEFKALAATQAGFPTVSIPGVDTWHRKKSSALVGDLARIEWNRRRVYIAFDSDAATNPQVADNVILLADALTKLGATVKIARFPAGPNGEKVGLDDYLVANGASALAELLTKAEEPEKPTGAEGKAHAAEIDPAPEAQAIIEAETVMGFCRVRWYRGQFSTYRAGCYEECSIDEVRPKVICWLNRGYSHVTPGVTNAVLDQLKAQSHLSDRIEAPAWLMREAGDRPANEVLSVGNGLLHLPSAARGDSDCLLPATPRFFSRNVLPFKFDPNARAPEAWLEFLNLLWRDDPQAIETLQQWFGLALTSDTSQQKIMMLCGPKRSGKGTIARVLRAMVGERNVVGPTLAGLASNFGLAPLIDKLLAIVPDARLSGRTDVAIVVERLLAISGEDAQTIDRKFLPSITLKLPTRFMLLTNELPRLGDSSGAMASRIILLRLTESFYGREDHGLTDKLLKELPGILNWSIAGWRLLHDRGHLVQPESASDLIGDLEDLGSPISAFIRERCIIGPGFRASVSELYGEWRSWCEAKGRKDTGNEQTFGRDLSAAMPNLKRSRPHVDGGSRIRCYEGLGIVSQATGEW